MINNASTDRTARAALAIPGVRVIDERTKGLVVARERGRRESRGDLLVYVDADCRAPSHWLSLIEQHFARDRSLVALSGNYRFYDWDWLGRSLLRAYDLTLGPATHLLVKYVLRIGVVFYGGNFAVRRDALERIGGFDTTIEFHGEDTNLGRRLSRIGNVDLRYDCFLYTSARRYNAMGKGGSVPALRSQLRFRAVASPAERPGPPGRSSVRVFSIDNRKPQARYVVRAICLKKARLP